MLSSPSRPRTRTASWPLLVLTVLALVLGGLSLPASAATPADVAGAVTGRNGAAVPGVSVRLGTLTGSTFTPITGAQATTAADGTWKTAVPDDTQEYVVQYSSTAYDLAYLAADGATTTTPAEAVKSKGAKSDLTAQLRKGSAEVAGRVIRAGSLDGDALRDVTVRLYEGDTVVNEGTTGTDGTYTMDDVVPGSYVVQFSRTDHTTTYYKAGGTSTKDRAQAGTITVPAGQTTRGIDGSVADLVRSQVGGIVRTTGGAPIKDAAIRFYTRNPADANTGTVTYTPALGTGPAAGVTGSDGTWKVERDFAPYVVEVRAPAYGTFYYKGSSLVTDPASAEEVQVKEGVARRLDATLGNASTTTISGTVTTAGGQPVQGVTISVETGTTDASGQTAWTEVQKTQATTGSDGTYSALVPPVDDQMYVVGFHAPGFETQYYNAKATRTAADKVRATFKDAAAGIDASLSRAGKPVNLSPPWIAGQAVEDGTLTAMPGAWSVADVKYTYQWFQSNTATGPWDVAIGTSNTETYKIPRAATPLEPFQGKHYLLHVTASRITGEVSQVAVSKPTGKAQGSIPPADPKTENRQDPQVTGRAAVGETLTGTNGEWSRGGTFERQWLADGQAIAGATASTLVIGAAQLGKKISLKVTETSNDPDVVVFSTSTVEVVRGALRATTLPSVKGQPVVGKPLTADPGTWNATNPSFTYQWLSGGQDVPGATGTTYTPTGADEGKVISVRVGATGAALDPGSATSEPTAPVGPDPTVVSNRTAPRISGTPRVGETLTASEGTWTNEPTSFTYQWLADGAVIAGATRSTHELTGAEAGKRVTVRVTAAKAGLTSGTSTSEAVGPVASGPITNTARPVVSGTAAPGGTLTSSTGTWEPGTGLTYTYQWRADGTPIAGATSPSIVVTESMVGKSVSVAVTAAQGGERATAVSEPRTVDATPVQPVVVTSGPRITGTPVVGEELVVDTGTSEPAGATRAVQWLRGTEPITGAIGTRYRLTSADAGSKVSARVTYSQEGFADTVRTTDAVGPVGSSTPGVQEKPQVKVGKSTRGSKVVLRVKVLADAVDPVTGEVVVKENGRTLAAKTLEDGRRKLVVRGLERGFHTLRVKFRSDSDLVRNGKKTISFRIR